jgi:diguanylate cyclase (GGDEF)-like protein
LTTLDTRIPLAEDDKPEAQEKLFRLLVSRCAIWLFAVPAAAALGEKGGWGWLGALVGLIASVWALSAFHHSRLTTNKHAAVVGLDIAAVTSILATTGGFSSPMSILFLATTAEGFALFGIRGGILAGLAAATTSLLLISTTITLWEAAAFAAATLLLTILAVVASRYEKRPAPKSTALAPPRTVEQIEELLHETEEMNHRLRTSYRDLAGAVREQKGRMDELGDANALLTLLCGNDDVDTLQKKLLHCITDRLEAAGGALWIVHPHTRQVRCAGICGDTPASLLETTLVWHKEMLPRDLRIACEDTLRATAPTHRRRTHLPENPTPEETLSAEEEALFSDSGAGVSFSGDTLGGLLRDQDNIVGVITLFGPRAHKFDVTATRRMAAMGPVLGRALQDLEQRRRIARSVHELSVLAEMGQLVQNVTDPEELYQVTVHQIQRLVDCDHCTFFLFDAQQQRLEPKASTGRIINLVEHIAFEHGNGISGWVARKRKLLHIPDLLGEKRLLNMELMPTDIRSFLCVPMVVQGQVVGVLNISHARPNAFSSDDIRVIGILASQAAVAIERGSMLQQLTVAALTDPLTEVYNRRHFEHQLTNELKRAQRYGHRVSLLLVDIDRFKRINDKFGHQTGDIVLQHVVDVMRRVVRETDVLARYGGDEIALILPCTGLEDAQIVAERIRATVEAAPPAILHNEKQRLTLSIGVAAFPEHGSDRDRLLQITDQALYEAKAKGRNRVVVAEGAMAVNA